MTLNELMLEQEIEARQLRLARAGADALDDFATPRRGVRPATAALLVRVGTRLDRRAAELAVRPAQPVSPGEVRHAL